MSRFLNKAGPQLDDFQRHLQRRDTLPPASPPTISSSSSLSSSPSPPRGNAQADGIRDRASPNRKSKGKGASSSSVLSASAPRETSPAPFFRNRVVSQFSSSSLLMGFGQEGGSRTDSIVDGEDEGGEREEEEGYVGYEGYEGYGGGYGSRLARGLGRDEEYEEADGEEGEGLLTRSSTPYAAPQAQSSPAIPISTTDPMRHY
ncbi:hypothetical protein HK102_013720, partial [Quaeritorhiza haematococci]